MEIHESIAQVAAKLDEWFASNQTVFTAEDYVAQGKALLQGFAIVKELDALRPRDWRRCWLMSKQWPAAT